MNKEELDKLISHISIKIEHSESKGISELAFIHFDLNRKEAKLILSFLQAVKNSKCLE